MTLRSRPASRSNLFRTIFLLHFNPFAKVIRISVKGVAGLTGDKIIINANRDWDSYGGSTFSGTDPTNVDKFAAFISRQKVKSVG